MRSQVDTFLTRGHPVVCIRNHNGFRPGRFHIVPEEFAESAWQFASAPSFRGVGGSRVGGSRAGFCSRRILQARQADIGPFAGRARDAPIAVRSRQSDGVERPFIPSE